jgi:hypothetical protein
VHNHICMKRGGILVAFLVVCLCCPALLMLAAMRRGTQCRADPACCGFAPMQACGMRAGKCRLHHLAASGVGPRSTWRGQAPVGTRCSAPCCTWRAAALTQHMHCVLMQHAHPGHRSHSGSRAGTRCSSLSLQRHVARQEWPCSTSGRTGLCQQGSARCPAALSKRFAGGWGLAPTCPCWCVLPPPVAVLGNKPMGGRMGPSLRMY